MLGLMPESAIVLGLLILALLASWKMRLRVPDYLSPAVQNINDSEDSGGNDPAQMQRVRQPRTLLPITSGIERVGKDQVSQEPGHIHLVSPPVPNPHPPVPNPHPSGAKSAPPLLHPQKSCRLDY